MLETVKKYINEIPDVPFDEFYQGYICDVQDQNVLAEIHNIKVDEIVTLNQLISKLNRY